MAASGKTVRREIQLPLLVQEKVGAFIGRGGEHIRRVEKLHNVIINLSKAPPEGQLYSVAITGTDTAVTLASLELEDHTLTILNNSMQHCVQIPSAMVAFLIGTRGASISRIRDISGVRIDIFREDDDDKEKKTDGGLSMTTLRLTGNYTSIDVAIAQIRARLEDFGKGNAHNDASKRQFFDNWDEVTTVN